MAELRIEPTGAPLGVFVYGLEVDVLTPADIERQITVTVHLIDRTVTRR